jgi:hypothetical protein
MYRQKKFPTAFLQIFSTSERRILTVTPKTYTILNLIYKTILHNNNIAESRRSTHFRPLLYLVYENCLDFNNKRTLNWTDEEYQNTGLFEMTVRVLTTCHTRYT